MQKNRKKISKILFFIIAFPPVFFSCAIVVISITETDLYFGPHLSERTVLSLYDNLSNLTITDKLNFKDDRFYLKICNEDTLCSNPSLQNKAIAYITDKRMFVNDIYFYRTKFYYDTIDNCNKYYEVSYNPETNTALCIYGYISRINPFSAKIIYK